MTTYTPEVCDFLHPAISASHDELFVTIEQAVPGAQSFVPLDETWMQV